MGGGDEALAMESTEIRTLDVDSPGMVLGLTVRVCVTPQSFGVEPKFSWLPSHFPAQSGI